MSTASEWVARNLSLGGLVRNAGRGLGKATGLAARGAGHVVVLAVRDQDDKQRVEEVALAGGQQLERGLTKVGELGGTVVDKAVDLTSGVTGATAGRVAQALGASQQVVTACEISGRVLGAAAVGAVVGGGIANAAVGIASAAGTSGAAATSSGLAALGGGAVSAGGGGMAVGQAVVNGIVATGAASGVVSADVN